jgi:hypothetical protein
MRIQNPLSTGMGGTKREATRDMHTSFKRQVGERIASVLILRM